jgi:glycine oxidase
MRADDTPGALRPAPHGLATATVTRRTAAIVGGGIIGLMAAWRLARAGWHVVVLDAAPEAREASWAAAGMLAPHHEADGPGPLWRLGVASLARWHDVLRALPGHDFDAQHGAGLLPARRGDRDQHVALARREEWLAAHAVTVHRLHRADLDRLRPRLHDDIDAALLLPAFAIDPRHALRALTAEAFRLGIDLRYGTTVTRIAPHRLDTDAGPVDADEVVLASGAWTPALAAASGFDLPGEPVKGQMLRLVPRDQAHPLWPHAPGDPVFIHGHGAYLVRRGDGSVVVGATMVDGGFDRRDDPAAVADLAARARHLVPGLATAAVGETWTGLRPRLRGGMPVIARVAPGLLLATGHFRNGILLAPITADILVHLADGTPLPPEAAPFAAWPPAPP